MWLKTVFGNEENNKIDWHLVLFFLNVFLVIYGYSLRGGSFQVVKLVRTAVVLFSLVSLFAGPGQGKYVFPGHKNWVLWIFIFINLLVLSFSVDFMKSGGRIIAWLPFLIYINYFITYLLRKYSREAARIKLIQVSNLAYAFPVLVMVVYANPIFNRNVYGFVIGGFKSNVLGWAGIVFFVTAVDLLINIRPTFWYRYFLLGGSFFAVLALVATGSRSSYLCLAVSLVILVVNSRRMKFLLKVLAGTIIVGFTGYALGDPESALNQRLEKSEQQLEKGESRLQMAEIALETMLENPELLLTGFGYDNFREGIALYRGIELDLPSHNSYLELFITTGFFSFLFFLVFLVLNTLVRYVLFDSRRFVFLPTFMIIPFFESNLNAGQFLFFPWMTFMFYYVHAGSQQYPIAAGEATQTGPKDGAQVHQPFYTLPLN
jgi:hypothetical protein